MENYLMQYIIKMNLLDLCFRDVEANTSTTKVEKEGEMFLMFITTSDTAVKTTRVNQLQFREGGNIISVPCEKSGLHCSRFGLNVG